MMLTSRFFLSYLLSNFLMLTGAVRRAKQKAFSGECILSIYLHDPSREEFEACVTWLLKNKFRILSTAQLEAIHSGEEPFPKGAAIITVDDGWRSNEANIVEVARNYNVPVTIFVATEPVEQGTFWWSYIQDAKRKKILKQVPNEERVAVINELKKSHMLHREAMTTDQIVRIAGYENITIGCHTHTHPILPNCSENQLWEELQVSRKKLEEWTQQRISYFAYPNGSFTERETKALDTLNYKLAFTTTPQYLTPALLNSRYELPRFEVLKNASKAENICRMAGVWEPLMIRLKSFLNTLKTKTYAKSRLDWSRKDGHIPFVNSWGTPGCRGGRDQ